MCQLTLPDFSLHTSAHGNFVLNLVIDASALQIKCFYLQVINQSLGVDSCVLGEGRKLGREGGERQGQKERERESVCQ